VGDYWRIYPVLAGAYVRARMQYRLSFWLRLISIGLADLVPLFLIGVVFTRFPAIQGWRWPEVALLSGFSQLAMGISRLFSCQLDQFDELIVSGEFDSFLTRPLPPLFHLLAVRFEIMQLGRILAGAVVLVVAARLAGVAFTPGNVAVALLAAVGGAMILFALTLIVASISFWQTRTGKLQDIVQSSARAFSEFPITIYPIAVRWVLTLLLPLALVTYFPAQQMLGRGEKGAMMLLLAVAALPMGILFLLIAIGLWQLGLRHYQSTGS
jgi:ABC-2 type transport system permease protein